MQIPYDEEYFLRGRESGKSLYENYRWLPDLTIPMAKRIVEHCGIDPNDGILDFGCSRGYLVRALTELGWNAEGIDISPWAIENADPAIKKCVRVGETVSEPYDWIISKDVLEHIEEIQLILTLARFGTMARKGIFIVVPLAGLDDEDGYVVEEYEKDMTHKIRWNLGQWVHQLLIILDNTWEVQARHRLVGIKDNYAKWPRGNGFITCRRLVS